MNREQSKELRRMAKEQSPSSAEVTRIYRLLKKKFKTLSAWERYKFFNLN